MRELAIILMGFISGSIMYSYCLPKLILRKDVRTGTKDENPGGYNAYMVHKKLGLFCILLDMLKGFLPVYLFVKKFGINTPWLLSMLLSPVLGHAFTPFLKGKGGKALSTAAGAMMGLTAESGAGLLLMFLALFFSFIIEIKPFESRVVIVLLIFDVVLLLSRMANIWINGGAWGITGILWFKQVQMKIEERPFSCTPIWKKA